MKKLLAGLASELHKINIKSVVLYDLIKEASAFDDFKVKHPQHADLFKNTKPAYYTWISKRLEDREPASEILSLINDFELYKQGLEKKDINQYRSLGDLRGTLELYLAKREERKEMEEAMKMAPGPEREQLLSKIKNKPKQKNFDASESVVIYEDDKFFVAFPITTVASQRLGKDTQWCTAATQTENRFSMYQSEGIRLYYILTKDGSGDNLSKIAYAMVKQGPTSNQTIYDSQDNAIEESLVSRHLDKSFHKIKSSILEHFSTQADTDVSGYYSRITPEDLTQALATQNFTKNQINSISNLIRSNNKNPEVLDLMNAESEKLKYQDSSVLINICSTDEDPIRREEAKRILLETDPINYAVSIDQSLPNDETRRATLRKQFWAYRYASTIDRAPRDDTRKAALREDPSEYSFGYEYAINIDKSPREDTRNSSLTGEFAAFNAYNYAKILDQAPRDDTRKAALLEPEFAFLYARYIDKLPRDDTRNVASKEPELAYTYATHIDKGPHEETRNAMINNFYMSRYERHIDKLSEKEIADRHKKRREEIAEKARLDAFNAGGGRLNIDWGDASEYD